MKPDEVMQTVFGVECAEDKARATAWDKKMRLADGRSRGIILVDGEAYTEAEYRVFAHRHYGIDTL